MMIKCGQRQYGKEGDIGGCLHISPCRKLATVNIRASLYRHEIAAPKFQQLQVRKLVGRSAAYSQLVS